MTGRLVASALLSVLAACTPASDPEQSAVIVKQPVQLTQEALTETPAATPTEPAPKPSDPQPVASGPTFNIESYCAKVAEAAGGSYMIEKSCREMERDAATNIPEAPQRVRSYCERVGDAVGGSYQIYATCIEQELGAAADL